MIEISEAYFLHELIFSEDFARTTTSRARRHPKDAVGDHFQWLCAYSIWFCNMARGIDKAYPHPLLQQRGEHLLQPEISEANVLSVQER